MAYFNREATIYRTHVGLEKSAGETPLIHNIIVKPHPEMLTSQKNKHIKD
jgi:hypothetical protein